MLNYLQAYCDINEIQEEESFLLVWKELEKDPTRTLCTFSIYGYVLKGFQELLQEKRDLESFMMMWDITSKEKLERNPLAYEWLEQIEMKLSLWNWDEFNNSIVVVDSAVEVTNSKEALEEIKEKIEGRGGILFVVK